MVARVGNRVADACCSQALLLACLALFNDSGRQRWSRSSHAFLMMHRCFLFLLELVLVLHSSCMLSGSAEAFLVADVQSSSLQRSS